MTQKDVVRAFKETTQKANQIKLVKNPIEKKIMKPNLQLNKF
jgi:hypothetical protein